MYEFNLNYYTIRLLKYKSDTYDNFIYHMAIDDSVLKIPIMRLKFSDKTAYIIANSLKSKCDNLEFDNNDISPTHPKESNFVYLSNLRRKNIKKKTKRRAEKT